MNPRLSWHPFSYCCWSQCPPLSWRMISQTIARNALAAQVPPEIVTPTPLQQKRGESRPPCQAKAGLFAVQGHVEKVRDFRELSHAKAAADSIDTCKDSFVVNARESFTPPARDPLHLNGEASVRLNGGAQQLHFKHLAVAAHETFSKILRLYL